MLSIRATIGHYQPLMQLNRDFHPGMFYAVSGVNGAGKSTLLRVLAGELEPLSGQVLLDAVPVTNPTVIGRITSIFGAEFYPDMSIGEHLAVLQRITGIDYDEAIETWRLAPILDQSPSRVSTGQRQRSFLAAHITLATDVLIMDEPESHLDADWVDVLCTILRGKAKDGVTVIVATHSPVVLAACDEIVRLET